jgi:hypothetical protein
MFLPGSFDRSAVSEDPAISALTMPMAGMVFRPGDPLGKRDNIYVDWIDLMNAVAATRDRGIKWVQIDCSFQPAGQLGRLTFQIPAGTWDWDNAYWYSDNFRGLAFDQLSFADNAFITNLNVIQGDGFSCVHDGLVHTPFNLPWPAPNAGSDITFQGGRIEMYNTIVGAKPMFKSIAAGGGLFGKGANVFGYELGRASVASPSPLYDLNGFSASFGSINLVNNALTDTSPGGTGIANFQNQYPRDAGGRGTAALTWSFPALPVTATILQTNAWRERSGVPTALITTTPFAALYSQVLFVSTAAAKTINLPTAKFATGEKITIKDATGGAATFNITVAAAAGETIDGAPTFVMATNFQAIVVQCDGTGKWYVVSVS